MGTQENGLALEALAKRLEALERENERMRLENAQRRSQVATLEGSQMPRNEEPPFELEERRVSRRQLLGKAGAAAAGLVVAGALTQRDIREAKAAIVSGSTDQANRGGVEGTNTNADGFGVLGQGAGIGVKGTSSSSNLGAVEGHNNGGGTGLVGVGKVGVLAFSHVDGWNAVWGRHTGNGRAIAGDSASGYGAEFKGGKAQLRLVPAAGTTGPPTGSHAKGELYIDSTATLFVCVAGGNPATWRKVTTTAV